MKHFTFILFSLFLFCNPSYAQFDFCPCKKVGLQVNVDGCEATVCATTAGGGESGCQIFSTSFTITDLNTNTSTYSHGTDCLTIQGNPNQQIQVTLVVLLYNPDYDCFTYITKKTRRITFPEICDCTLDCIEIVEDDPCGFPTLSVEDCNGNTLGPDYTFVWQGSDNSVSYNPSITPNSGVTYTVTVTDEVDCIFEDSFDFECDCGCGVPEDIFCVVDNNNTINTDDDEYEIKWTPVPTAISYRVQYSDGHPDINCCNTEQTIFGEIYTDELSINIDEFHKLDDLSCFVYRIETYCGDDTRSMAGCSSLSEWQCFDGDSCFGFGISPESQNEELMIKVYPNPIIDNINISMNEYGKYWSVELLNTEGKMLINKSVVKESQTNIVTSELNSGIYFLVIKDNNGNILNQERIIKE